MKHTKSVKLKSKRFCLTCNEWSIFKYDPIIKHSICPKCGKPWASRFPSVEWYENKIKVLNKKIEMLKKQCGKQK